MSIEFDSDILSAIVSVFEDTIQDKVESSLRDRVLPKLNGFVSGIANSEDPHAAAIYWKNSGYFFNAYPSQRPVFNQAEDYIELYMDGLTYTNITLETEATHPITPATRDVPAQDF